jgi:hypothetical protein
MGLIDDGDVRALARQMVGGARPENAGTDHDDPHFGISLRWHDPEQVRRV